MQQNVYMHNIPELAVKKKKNDNIGNLKINLNSLLIRFLFRFSAHTHLQAIYRDQVHVLCFICQMPPSCSSSPVWRAAIKVNGWQNKVHKKVFFKTKKNLAPYMNACFWALLVKQKFLILLWSHELQTIPGKSQFSANDDIRQRNSASFPFYKWMERTKKKNC